MSNNSDNWSNLLNDFGIEDTAKPDNAEKAVSVVTHTDTTVVETIAEMTNSVTVTTTSSVVEVEEVPSKSKERKSIFSRFPKINIFGLPPKDQIDAIANAGKSPSLAGKSFTGGTIEKTQGIVRRPEAGDRRPEEQATSGRGRGKSHETDLPATRSTPQQDSALPSIVSQLDTIASGEKPGRGRHRQPPVSLFEEPAQESDEYKALKNIFDDSAEKSRNPRGEGRRERQQEDRYSKRQPIVVVDDVTLENEWQEVDDEPVVVEERPRNRRGSFDNPEGQRNNREQQPPRTNDRNYPSRRGGVISGDRVVQHDIDEPAEDRNRSYGRRRDNRNAPESDNTPQRSYAPRDNYSRNNRNVSRDDYARDDHNAPEGGNTPQRSYAPRTRGERVVEREPIVEREYEVDNDSAFIEDDENQVQLHRNMPGWGDAIDDIIAGNMARHRNSQPYRGKR